MKILHAADLHIDSPLGGLAAYEGAPVEEIRGATRRATENLVQAAIEHEVDLVVVAGDVFDGDWRDYSTGLFWIGQLSRLNDAQIPVVMISGNHDAASVVSKNLRLPPNTTLLSDRHPETKVFDDLGVAIVGQGYATRSVIDDLAVHYPAADAGLFTVGLLHSSLTGRPGHADYAPTSVEILRAKGYQYWALGHIHQREVVSRDPWIVYSGNIQGRHARETGPKGATLVTVEGARVANVEAIDLDVVRWHLCAVDASGSSSADHVLAAVTEKFAALTAERGSRLVVARVEITGASAAHDEMWRNPQAIEAEVRATARQLGGVWVENVKLETRRLVDLERLRDDEAVAELSARIDQLKSHPELLEAFAPQFDALRTKLAADVHVAAGAPLETSGIGGPAHLAQCLEASRELIIALLAEDAE